MIRVTLFRLVATLLATIALPVFAQSESPLPVGEFVKRNCIDCHGGDASEGNFRVDQLSFENPNRDQLARLVLLYDRVHSGEMPPQDADQPSPAEKAAFLGELRTKLIAIEKKIAGESGGRTSVRRMNRVEYESTLRDLLALPLLSVKDLLPEDGQQFGFDKVAGALDFSHIQMTKYLQAADFALGQAVVKTGSRPETKTWREPAARQDTARGAIAIHCAAPLKGRELAPGLKTHVVGNPDKDYGNTYRAATFSGEADSVAVFTGVIGAHQPEGIQIDHFRPTVSGWYRVKFSTWSLRWERTKAVPAVRGLVRNFTVFGPPYFKNDSGKWEFTPLPEEKPDAGRMENVEFYGETETTQIIRASLKGEVIGFFDAPSLKPKVHEFKLWLNPGERISLHAMTLPATGARNGGQSNGVVTYEGPGVAYDWFEVEGPLIEQWPPASQQRLFGDKPPSAYPRPMLTGAPTVQPGETFTLPVEKLSDAGQIVGTERLLNVNGTTNGKINCAVAGEYEVSVTASETPAGDEAAEMRFLLNGLELPHARFTVDAPRSAPKTYRAKFRVESAGPVTLGVEFTNDFLDETNPNPKRRDRNLFLSGIEVSAAKAAGAVAATATTLGTDSHWSLLLSFATQAFRRPVATDEITPYASIIEAQLESGNSFEEAMLAGYKAVLCSPDFLLIGLESGVPQSAKNAPTKLGDYALASRLSFFLWNSIPDATLLELAAQNSLSKPATLQAQVERMLADPRSERFVEHFLDEWLELKKIDFTTPDPNLYPEYDPWLHDSMLAETRASFRRMLTKNLGVREVVASDTLLINQRLAELYGIRGVNGADLREVKVPAGTPRGGFLTQAAILKVTANGTATSPVMRGVWIMERILGIPRQPPPQNVAAIEPDATGAVTIRQMLEKHRADVSCAACHAKMDPPGFALENFDVIGGWRDRYRLAGQPKKTRQGKEVVEEPSIEVISDAALRRNRVKIRLGTEVDASGELADGRKFTDVTSFRTFMLQDEDALARNVARQLMIYATGAGVRFSDREAINTIIAKTKPTHHGLRSIVEAVVASDLFQTK
ncbi:hypothetical protein ETAA8_13160 [Anatilimnocola aggregata]|uniref:DUF1592 domain-containing protein n=1 Tax=Anatilimnocola aggregata TaxID=2528021 RepID=A0A517Y7M1_9BACT|nr:DUF1592 domain-containing protein [Anatilimnocola aggregata]QDU26240.1 hypothetical protein ETAA8_13160 [Anatilimnocola aggregata]